MKNKIYPILLVGGMLAASACMFYGGFLYGRNDGYDLAQASLNTSSCDMRFPRQNILGLEGVYSHPNYICVWTKDRTALEITETWSHEMGHLYAHRDGEHFCGVSS